MAPNWPSSPPPTLNQTYTDGGITWIFDGFGWNPAAGSGTFVYWPIALSPPQLGLDLLGIATPLEIRLHRGIILTEVPVFTVRQAPTITSIALDVYSASSIYETGEQPEIEPGEFTTGTSAHPGIFSGFASTHTFPAGSDLFVDLNQIGSGDPGVGLTMWLTGKLL